ncbi:helix-turn-helix domain-containing protein [Actinoplanes lobatus]|uniref:Transcriptional regulator with XRE-family HTH domain n=1 Tax=Actinoplanes lobatus TaxID=113568 RepID=A0A7W7MLZ9_9ACTN|nr:helix-turn-helix transcriptional regulator [Actinoplanes lobatus]MBB4755314.1 transcriptional regulator with XRE-family HTH domain [Actinoplanes lobatus]GIE46189.1 hypothetical protein Alo02nite_90870 [Actinoplanes lobatus]
MIRIDTTQDLAEALLLLRQLRGLTQPAVAEPAGICFTRVSKYERGVSVPGVEKLIAVLGAMGYGLAIVPLIETAPETAPASTLADDHPSVGVPVGPEGTEIATEAPEAFCCNRHTHPGHADLDGTHCDTCGGPCRDESDLEDA